MNKSKGVFSKTSLSKDPFSELGNLLKEFASVAKPNAFNFASLKLSISRFGLPVKKFRQIESSYPWPIRYAIRHGLYLENKSLADAIPRPKGRLENFAITVSSVMEGLKAFVLGENSIAASIRYYIEQGYLLQEPPRLYQVKNAIALPDLRLLENQSLPSGDRYANAFDYVHRYWPELVRQTPEELPNSLIGLPHPYAVPGGRFNEMYYWDSYFIILGLKVSGLSRIICGMVDNFLYLIERYNHIPNGNRTYYLSRSQPPFLTAMIRTLIEDNSPDGAFDWSWLARAFEMAKREYHLFWMDKDTRFLDIYGLNRYFDPVGRQRFEGWGADNPKGCQSEEYFRNERAECESGWDFTNRFDERCTDFLPIDLNCLLYQYEKDFATFAAMLGQEREAVRWRKRMSIRRRRIQQLFWNERDGLFYDFDMRNNTQFRYPSLAGYFALWAGVATPAQAERMARNIGLFEEPGGLVTSLNRSGKQWDAPNGWAPLQWIVLEGLKKYGYQDMARRIGQNWVDLCTQVFESHGKFYEKYNVRERNITTPGGYPIQEGFGWTNGAYATILVDILGYKVE